MFRRQNKIKKRVEKVVEEKFWEGFTDWTIGVKSGLQYASDSGWYSYNEARKIAYDAGWDYAKHLTAERDRGKKFLSINRKIPAHVYADAYASMRLI